MRRPEMCGRYAITLPPEAVRSWFLYEEQPNFPPRYNVAPTQPIPIVCGDPTQPASSRRQFKLVRWGFVPSFVKDFANFPLIINARLEDIGGKPSFRAALVRRRCLVIADGYYEWRKASPGGPGAPFLVQRSDRQPMGFAGLWEGWMGADGSEIETACIITTVASPALATIHPRMPALLEAVDYPAWLACDDIRSEAAIQLIRQPVEGALTSIAIGSAVNKVANDDPSIQAPLDGRPAIMPSRQGSLF